MSADLIIWDNDADPPTEVPRDVIVMCTALVIPSSTYDKLPTSWCRTIRDLMLAGYCLLITCGCALTVPVNPDGPDDKTKPGVETVWTCLASEVEAGEVPNSSVLELIVKRLRARSHISDADVDKFYKAFDGIKDKEREITSADAKLLRGI